VDGLLQAPLAERREERRARQLRTKRDLPGNRSSTQRGRLEVSMSRL